jgi:23S rRNA pseudouridine1911/1915/1917 synthase
MAGYRLDKALAELFPTYSRSRLQQWIRDGHVSVNANLPRAKDKVQGGEDIQVIAPIVEEVDWQAQDIPIDLLYEDLDILVVNKSAGLVVHPGAGNRDHTLVNALLNHAPELAQLPRAGIIHRLDKGTTGVLVVARSLRAYHALIKQQQARQFVREYQAIVKGVLVAGGCIDAPIGRHPVQRTKMAIVANGKPARTHYRITRRFRAYTRLQVSLETGRTHQIRVHLAHQHYPLLGDITYGGRLTIPSKSQADFVTALQAFQRPALHAECLGFVHPVTQKFMEWKAPLPTDLQILLTALEQDKQAHD